MVNFALVGRKGAYPARYTAKQVRAMYAEGVRLSAADLLQVWSTLDNGDLLAYDAARTRKLSDRVVNARNDARRAAEAELAVEEMPSRVSPAHSLGCHCDVCRPDLQRPF